MNKTDLSRRKFLSRTALTLPVAAAAIPAAMEITSPMTAEAASLRQDIPNRSITARNIGPTTVTVSGLHTDEETDCAQIIQDEIDNLPSGGGTIIIPRIHTGGTYSDGSSTNRCIYKINPQRDGINKTDPANSVYWALKIPSNVRLECKPGVVLEAMTINTDPDFLTTRAYLVYCQDANDIEFINCTFVGERQTHINSGLKAKKTDEWCHGIQIVGCSGVTVLGCCISDCTGDGIDIGKTSNNNASDIVICNSVLTTNRRQALSITQGTDISCYDSEFSFTYGTLPMDGIDIEPQGSAFVTNVTIDNCLIRGNEGNGIECNIQGTSVTNVTVSNCLIQNNYYNGFWTHGTGTITTGSIHGNAFYQNGNYGLSLGGGTSGYTIGGPGQNGTWSNNFADNQNLYNAIQWPNTNRSDISGYVSGGTDVNASTSAQTANTWNYNSYYTP